MSVRVVRYRCHKWGLISGQSRWNRISDKGLPYRTDRLVGSSVRISIPESRMATFTGDEVVQCRPREFAPTLRGMSSWSFPCHWPAWASGSLTAEPADRTGCVATYCLWFEHVVQTLGSWG